MKIIDYAIVSSSDETKLSGLINEGIRNGWQPFGSLCGVAEGETTIAAYFQPMVKYAPDVPPVHTVQPGDLV